MVVKIVTDSGSDLPCDLVKQYDIAIVPVYIFFGSQAYKDGIDITPDELYSRLIEGSIHPTTAQPMPVDFANMYTELSKDYDEILSIHLSSKVSGTYNSAIQGRKMYSGKAKIEVVDSQSLSMGLGLIALALARLARSGIGLEDLVKEALNICTKIKIFGVLDTLKYLLAGGRVTKSKAIIGSILNIKPVLTLKDGEIVQYAMERSYSKGMDRIVKILKGIGEIAELAIVYSTDLEKAEILKHKLIDFVSEEKILTARLGAGLGVHGGPGTLFTTVRLI